MRDLSVLQLFKNAQTMIKKIFLIFLFVGFFNSGYSQSVDNITILSSDPKSSLDWYLKYFGGKKIDRSVWTNGKIKLRFGLLKDVKRSEGKIFDHIGFSVNDLDLKLEEIKDSGFKKMTKIKVVGQVIRMLYIEDPFGVKIELLEEPDRNGLHHIHQYLNEPEKVRDWYYENLGGLKENYKNMMMAIDYDNILLFFSKASKYRENIYPTGNAIDRITFKVDNVNAVLYKIDPSEKYSPIAKKKWSSIVFGPEKTKIQIISNN